jgi:deoxyribodipyrimidine photolyase-related protein
MNLLIFPNGLFENNNIFANYNIKNVFVIEHPKYFTDYNFHIQKLILHRSTMKYYCDYITDKYKIIPQYIDANQYTKKIKIIFKYDVICHDPTDFDVRKDIIKYSNKYIIIDTPLFLTPIDILDSVSQYKHKDFYIWQRKRLDILIKNNKPIGGKWSFDKENRKPFDKKFNEIKINIDYNSDELKYLNEAKQYVKKNFDNVGSFDFYLPITFKSIKKYFNNFLIYRLQNFGKYEDAISNKINFGCHSVISPLLNIGMITPLYVITQVIKKYTSSNLASIEGFIRQVIGWREYVRMNYIFNKDKLVNDNILSKNKNKLSKKWYTGGLPIPPINDVINKTLKISYAHHIERLMIVGNFMLLTKINPKYVYKWFMELFIDSYEWVMIPNVYGMSQYSTKIMMTRPYFSSSNYIFKMSAYKKKDQYPKIKLGNYELDWYELWDSLYYSFIGSYYELFKKNYALANSAKYWKSMSPEMKNKHNQIYKLYVSKY